MSETRTLIWGLVHGMPHAQIMYGDPTSPAGKSLIEEAYYKVLQTHTLSPEDPTGLDALKEKYPCPTIESPD